MSKHITRDQKDKIIKYYLARPITIRAVAENFNLSDPSIIKILNEYRIKRYTKVQLYSPELIENYFENIDDEFKAYFLGLIITDGCIHNTKGKQSLISITLNEKDKYLLDAFKKHIKSNKNITYDGRGCCQITILSNKMVNDLKQYGLIPNKSLKTVFPSNIPNHLYPHLIRGMIDGDGSIAFYARKDRKKCHTKAICFCQGNKKFIEDLVNFLYRNTCKKGINMVKCMR